jgi:hypothetical protein
VDATTAIEIGALVRKVSIEMNLCETKMSILRCDVMAMAIEGKPISEVMVREMAERRRGKPL